MAPKTKKANPLVKYLAIIAILIVMAATMFFLAQGIAGLAEEKSKATGLVLGPISVDQLLRLKPAPAPRAMEPISVD